MPNWKKVIVSGSNAILNNITASGDISASGDIYATNFIGTVATSSVSEKVKVSGIETPGGFPVVFTGTSGKYQSLYKDATTSDFYYSPTLNTLYVTNLSGTASLATTAVTASYISASNIGGGVTISNNVNNRILTATGTQTINGESGLTFNGASSLLTLTGNFTINPQGYLGFVDIGSTPGGGYAIIGDENESNNATYLKVDDDTGLITLSFTSTPVVHTFDENGLNITGNLSVDTITNVNTTHITASGNISASGDLYSTHLFIPQGNSTYETGLIFGEIAGDSGYIYDDGTNLQIGYNDSDILTIHDSGQSLQVNGNTQISGDTNINGNLTVSGDITAEQYIVNSTVTNVTMSFSSGSTIFGDSLDDTHLFTGSVDITGSLTVDGMTYPTTDGENGDVITTDGAGNLSIDKPKIYMQVKNAWSTTLPKGTPVYASSSTGNLENVKPASASNADTMPAIGVLASDLDVDGEGLAIVTGFINGVDTSAFNESDVVYVGANGGFTNVKPTGSNLIQNLGIVTKVDASNGSGFVYGSGRANDVPNISPGYAWVGNSDSVAIAVPTSSFAGAGDNLGNHIATQDLDMAGFSISASLNITASGNISASGGIVGNSLYSDEFINIKGTEYPISSFYTIETEPGQNYKEGVIHFSGSIDDVNSTVFDIFKISTGSNQILQLDYQVSWYRSNVLWTSVGHKSKLIVGPLMTSEGINDNNPTVGDFNVFISTGNTSYLYTNLVYPLDGGETYTTWSSSFQDEYLQYSINYADSTYSGNIHENGDEVKININYKLIKSI